MTYATSTVPTRSQPGGIGEERIGQAIRPKAKALPGTRCNYETKVSRGSGPYEEASCQGHDHGGWSKGCHRRLAGGKIVPTLSM